MGRGLRTAGGGELPNLERFRPVRGALATALAQSSIQTQFATQGAEAKHSTPEALGRHMQTEIAKWRDVARAAGVKI